nr:uracil-DNA glycosylase [Bordetella trematum]
MMPAPRPNPLQRLWLREIGIEKTWQRAETVAPAAPASRVSQPEAAPAAARADLPVAHRLPPETVAPAAAVAAPAAPERQASTPDAPPAVTPSAATEVARRVAHADLAQLREQVLACTACGLCQGRKHAVFGDGAQTARWMVVGEAPGQEEDRSGLPFVGRSGRLLDAMLAAVGMSRERDVFIANVIKCRPPGNRNPKPEEIAACGPYLMRQITLLRPERILVLGRFAAQTLLGVDASIANLRGRLHQLKADDGREIPVVVSYHPAYLLRSPSEKARAWQDLRLAAKG